MAAVRRAIVLAIAVLVVVPGAAHAATGDAGEGRRLRHARLRHRSAGGHRRASSWSRRRGTIQVLDGAARSTFLDITSKVDSTDNERGLLSMAFALDYSTSGLFYVYYTAKARLGQVTIEEHRVDPANPDRADPSYARPLVTIPHDQQANHNGGQLQFGPDGLLYAGTGDGGSGGDPSGNAQTTTPAPPTVVSGSVNHDYRLGKLLRIDPAHRRRLDLRLRPAQPVALLLRPQHRRPRSSATSARTATRRSTSPRRRATAPAPNYGWNTYEGAAHLSGRRAGRRRARHRPAGHRVPAQPGVLDHRRLRGARRRPCPSCGHLPVRRQLHGRHLGRHAAGGHDAHAGLHGGQRVELRRGRLRARLRRVARRRRLPLREQRRVRRAGALRRPAARRRRRGPARRRARPTARRRSPCCAPRRASTRCAPASSPSASAATSGAP